MPPLAPTRITVGSHKGGVGKTTTAVSLATLLGLAGPDPVVLVDADPQRSTTTWWRMAERAGHVWPERMSLIEWRSGEPFNLPPAWGAHVVIDTGPNDPQRLRDAVALSDTVVVPVACRTLDVAQVGATLDTVADAAQGRDVTLGVLLTMVKLGTIEADEVPAALAARELPTFDTVIPERRSYARLFGTVPDLFGAYGDVLAELGDAATEVTR